VTKSYVVEHGAPSFDPEQTATVFAALAAHPIMVVAGKGNPEKEIAECHESLLSDVLG
jgi:hypothetical protein